MFKKIKYYYQHIGLAKLIVKIISYPFKKIRNNILEKKIFEKTNNKDVFSEIYNTNYWNEKESKSGTGSSIKSTENIRTKLPIIIKEFNIKSIIDAPCGDFFWFSKIINDFKVQYLGCDIVEKIILENKKFENEKIKFKQFDLIKDEIPHADLLICRDCLFHFSFKDIEKTFKNFKKSKFKYILITNHDLENTEIINEDIHTGSFRFIDFHLSPFNFKRNYTQKILDLQ